MRRPYGGGEEREECTRQRDCREKSPEVGSGLMGMRN